MGKTGCRAKSVGAPARGSNPLTPANLLGLGTDPVSGHAAGCIVVTEKGGKHTEHNETDRPSSMISLYPRGPGARSSLTVGGIPTATTCWSGELVRRPMGFPA